MFHCCLPIVWCHVIGPLHQIIWGKIAYFFKLCLNQFPLNLNRIHSDMTPINCEIIKQICPGNGSKNTFSPHFIWCRGPTHQPPWWPGPMTSPWLPHGLTAPQQFLLGLNFNLISINYGNLWLHTLNLVEGWMWIGKKISLNNFMWNLSFL